MIFFLAFLLRIVHFHGVNDKVALASMVVCATAGGFLGSAVGSAVRTRRPYLITFGMLAAATVITAVCAAFWGLWAALVVALVAAFGQVLAKLALDSTVQQEIGEATRSSVFGISETLHQLSWVAGGLAGIAMSFTSSGVAGLAFCAVGLGVSTVRCYCNGATAASRHGSPTHRPFCKNICGAGGGRAWQGAIRARRRRRRRAAAPRSSWRHGRRDAARGGRKPTAHRAV